MTTILLCLLGIFLAGCLLGLRVSTNLHRARAERRGGWLIAPSSETSVDA